MAYKSKSDHQVNLGSIAAQHGRGGGYKNRMVEPDDRIIRKPLPKLVRRIRAWRAGDVSECSKKADK